MTRMPTYRWRLRELMATHGLFTTTALMPLLTERGIELSASQVHRLVTQTPERLNLTVLAALCDILECTPADLIPTDVQTRTEQVAVGAPVLDMAAAGRPRRARVRPDA